MDRKTTRGEGIVTNHCLGCDSWHPRARGSVDDSIDAGRQIDLASEITPQLSQAPRFRPITAHCSAVAANQGGYLVAGAEKCADQASPIEPSGTGNQYVHGRQETMLRILSRLRPCAASRSS